MADNQYLNGPAGNRGLSSPFANVDAPVAEDQLHSPFADATSEPTGETSVWEAFKSSTAAKFDAIAAATLEDEGSDRSRYAMARAERTQKESANQMAELSPWQRRAVMAGDIGTGIALNAIPEVGTLASAAYFGAGSLGQELMNEKAETSRYDLQRAGTIAGVQAALGPVVGGATGKALGYVAPKVASAIGTAAEKVLPTAGAAIGRTAETVAAPAGYLLGDRAGKVVGNVLGKGIGGTARQAGQYVGETVIPQMAKGASQIATSRLGNSVIGGGVTGGSMQMVSNLGNGKPLMENVGEAFEGGALAGGAVHAGQPVVSSVVRRVPTTIGMLKNNITGNRFEPTSEPIPEAPPVAPRTTTAEEAAIPTGEEPQPSGAIPAEELHSPFAANEPGSIPGSQNFDPNMYGNGGRGGLGDYVQPGQGIGGGRPMGGFGDITSNAGEIVEGLRSGVNATLGNAPETGIRQTATNSATTLWNQFKKDGLAGIVSPKAVKQMSADEVTTEALGLPHGSELSERSRAFEGSADIMQQHLESIDPTSPEYKQQVRASVNLALDSGSAAAHSRANQLALETEMPATSAFHDVTLTHGLTNKEGAKNVASDIYGISPAEIMQEHNAIKNSQGIALPFTENMTRQQIERFQTYESHYDATRDSFLRGESKWENALTVNHRMVKDMKTQLRESEEPELYDSARILDNAMKDYKEIMSRSTSGKPIDAEHLGIVSQQITENATKLGLMSKFKNVLGQEGTFNPVVDAQAWHDFSMRTRQMHSTAPKGAYKDMLESGDLGIGGIDFQKPGTWIKPVSKVVMSGVDRARSAASQAKGAAMLKASANTPARGPAPEEGATQANLRAGDVEGATESAETALNNDNIATGHVELADSPAQEVQQAQSQNMATRQQILELARRGHPAAEDENLTQEAADLFLAHDDMVSQNRAAAGNEPSAENVAAMAQGRPEETPVVQPEPEVAPEPQPEAPVEPVAPFEGNKAPSQLPEPQAAPEPASEPQAPFEGIRKPKPLTPKEIERYDELNEKLNNTKRGLTEGESKEMDDLGQRLGDEHLQEPEQAAPEAPETTPEPTTNFAEGNTAPKNKTSQEAIEEPTAQKEVNQKAPRKLAEPESEPAKTTEEEPAAKEEVSKEPEEVADKYTVEDKIPTEATDFKEGETSGQRNKRVADMARSLVKKEVAGIKQKPMKNSSIEEKRKAEWMSNGIETALKQANKLADEQGIERADVYTAIMNQDGGINSLFSEGHGADAVKGAVRSAIKKYKAEQSEIAKQTSADADEVIRRRLGEKKIGSTKEERDDRARADMLALKGVDEKVINEAFKRAEGVTPNYTVKQVIGHARQIVRENVAKSQPKRKSLTEQDLPIVKSRKTLNDYVKSTGASGKTLRDLNKIVDSATEVGGGEIGSRQALSADELDGVIKQIHETLAEAAKTAQEAKKTSTSKVPTVQKKLQDVANAAGKTASKAKAGEGSLRSQVEKLQKDFEATNETLKKEQAAREEAEKSHAEVQQKLADLEKDYQQRTAEALADAKSDMREEARTKTTESLKQFGDTVSEHFPRDVSSAEDPAFQTWKAKIDVAAAELQSRGSHKEAQFLKGLSSLLNDGLTRLEEMPDRRDLTMSFDKYDKLRGLYQEMKKGEMTTTVESLNSQWGTMGQKIRALLFGHTGEYRKGYSESELKTARAKHKLEKEGAGDAGIDAPGIK